VSPLVAWTEEDQNEAALDPWSAVHAGAGLAAGLTGIPVWLATVAAIGYEVVEAQFERTPTGQAFFDTQGPESRTNQVVDVLVFVLGVWAGSRYKRG
jgi:hypothetical protein